MSSEPSTITSNMLAIYACLRPKKAFNPSACLLILLIFRTKVAEGFEFQTLQNHSAADRSFSTPVRLVLLTATIKKFTGELTNPGFAPRVPATNFSKPGLGNPIPATAAMPPALKGLKGLKNKPFSHFCADTHRKTKAR